MAPNLNTGILGAQDHSQLGVSQLRSTLATSAL
jgi:hypothetical protein